MGVIIACATFWVLYIIGCIVIKAFELGRECKKEEKK